MVDIDGGCFIELVTLEKEIGLFEATAYGVGIILGAGVYVLIGKATGIAGNSVWISFLIGAVVSSFTGLSYAELSSMYPKAAAEYVYVKRASENPLLAFLTAWMIIITGVISASTVALGFAGYFSQLFHTPEILVAVTLIAILSLVNYIGIKESAKANILFTFVEALGLALIVFLGLKTLGKVNYLEAPNGVSGILAASALIFFAYIGFEDVVNIAEETKNPERVVPKALILSIVITSLFYVAVAFSVVGLASWTELGASPSPLAYAASKALGGSAFDVMSVIALFATANTVLIILVVGSRMIFGVARDGALPQILSTIDPRRRTPWIAILCMMAFTTLFVLLGDLELIASVTSLGAFVTFALVNSSLIYLRYRRPDAERPFKVSLNIGRFPVIPFLGLTSCILMMTQFDLVVMASGLLFILLGILFYNVCGFSEKCRRNGKQK